MFSTWFLQYIIIMLGMHLYACISLIAKFVYTEISYIKHAGVGHRYMYQVICTDYPYNISLLRNIHSILDMFVLIILILIIIINF